MRWQTLLGWGMVVIAVMGGLVMQSPDWVRWIRPGVLHLLHGQVAYGGTGFYNPPWTAILLGPMALLPSPLDRVLLLAVMLTVYGRLASRTACYRSGSCRPPCSFHCGSVN